MHMNGARMNLLKALALTIVIAGAAFAQGTQVIATSNDPRIGLKPGLEDAAIAARNLELIGHADRLPNFADPKDPGSFGCLNGDLGFIGNYVFQGGFNGLQVWDISNPARPTLRTSMVCPGGQGDVSLYKNLLFMSVEETDRKSTRLNSSHMSISYAVFCLKKKKKTISALSHYLKN